MSRAYVLWAAALLISVPSGLVQAKSLRTQFAEVRISHVKIGRTYSLDKTLNMPLRIINMGHDSMELQIDVMAPRTEDLRPGYEPVIDTGWIKLRKNRFVLQDAQEAVSDVIISLPRDRKLLGRRFQALLRSHAIGQRGPAAALNSCLLIDVSIEPPIVEKMRKRFMLKDGDDLEFSLFPGEGRVQDIPVGQVIDLGKERKTNIKIVNPNDRKIHVHLRSVPVWEGPAQVPELFQETPDARFLKPDSQLFEMEPNGVKTINFLLEFPDDEKYKGGNYMFLVSAEMLEQKVPVRMYYKLFVRMRK